MHKTAVDLDLAYRLINPGSVVLVTVGDGERDNLFPVTWNMPVSDEPPMVAVLSSKDHFSYPFIERTGELGLNVPDASLVDAVYGCGKITGRDEPDKFRRFGLTRRRAEHIRPPLVEEAVPRTKGGEEGRGRSEETEQHVGIDGFEGQTDFRNPPYP